MTKSQNDARTYYMNTNDSCPTIAKYGRNLNLLYPREYQRVMADYST